MVLASRLPLAAAGSSSTQVTTRYGKGQVFADKTDVDAQMIRCAAARRQHPHTPLRPLPLAAGLVALGFTPMKLARSLLLDGVTGRALSLSVNH
jgi:hypothetical protein